MPGQVETSGVVLLGYDPVSHTFIPVSVTSVATDSTNNEIYATLSTSGSGGGGGADTQYTDGAATVTHPIGTMQVFDNAGTVQHVSAANPLPVNGTFTPSANQRVNAQANDFAVGAIADLATYLTLAGTPTDANTVASLMGRLTKIRDLLNGTLPISAASLPLPTGAAIESGGHLAAIDTATSDLVADLDTLITNTNKIPASPAQEAGNLATLVTQTADLLADGDHLATIDTNTANIPAKGQATMANSTPVAIASNQSTVPVAENAATSGGTTPFHAISAASTNGTNVKASAGQIYGICVSNSNAAARYFKLYDKATTPTVGTDTPKRTIQVPANGTVICVFPVGLSFALGIGFGYTTGIADGDTGATGTDASLDLDYK